MVSVTNPLMDSEIWGANLAGKCVACRSNKAFTPHPTISAVPLPDATLTRLIRPTGPEHRTVGWIRRFTLHPATVVGTENNNSPRP